MAKFPFAPQYDSMDCGSACIRMIAKYYGKNFSLDFLRELCFTSREGVSLLSISNTFETIGFKTVGGKITFNDLRDKALLPCILHWQQEHFVVLFKIEKSAFGSDYKIYIADPAEGIITYNKSSFLQKWISTCSDGVDKGVLLLMEPTQKFYNTTDHENTATSFSFLLSYFKKYRKYFYQLLIGLFLGSIIQLIFPFLTQTIVDKGIASKNISFIYIVLIAQLVLTLSKSSVEFIRRWILLHISTRINITLISDFLIKLMKLPMSYFDTKLTGDIMQRIEDHHRVENFLTVKSLNTIFSLFTLIIFSVVLLIYSIKIFAIFLSGSILYTLWVTIFLKKRRQIDYKRFEIQSDEQSKTYQLIQGMQEIKLQNAEHRKRWEWEDVQAELFNLNIENLKLEQKQEAGNIIINETKNIVITIFAALAVIQGQMSLGMMLATQYIIGQLTLPIEQIVALIYDIQDAKISLERINEIHVKNDENYDKINNQNTFYSINNLAVGSAIHNLPIKINNLLFQYNGPDSPIVLNNINLNISPGKVTAIVGASGSGKTTLIKLLLQYYEPTNGSIYIGNSDLNQLNTTWWRNRCGCVMQDGFIFSESIARNIATCGDQIDINRLKYAAQIANIDEFINLLPLKYNTIIGNEGQNLSQGQKQRLLIARAIYKNPDFLFLDEATNSLDANNEKAIVENLMGFYTGKTVIIVAHRLSTVKNADNIVVLNNGTIVEQGTHNELTNIKGTYYNLVKNQLELGN